MGLQDICIQGRPTLAVLIDPEKQHLSSLPILIEVLASGIGDVILIGGSTEAPVHIDDLILRLKASCSQPVVLFPGHKNQLSAYADYLLLPSIISGSSFKYLLGEHIENAQQIKDLNIPIMSTGYILMKGDYPSSTIEMTQSRPIENHQTEQLINVSLAGEMLGLNSLYLEAGSGAADSIPRDIVAQLKSKVNIPVIVGGGISSVNKLKQVMSAEPSMIVIGNALETQPKLLLELYAEILKHQKNHELNWSKSMR